MVSEFDRTMLALGNIVLGAILFAVVPPVGVFFVGIGLLIFFVKFKKKIARLVFGR
jgi:hypothetical protein